MATFKKSDMLYKDYSWTSLGKDNPNLKGPPDDAMFNRREGYEVLYLINNILKARKLVSVRSGRKMEKMIRTELPSNIRSQVNVKNWINANW